VSEIDPNLIKRGYVALDHLERHLAGAQFLVGDAFSLADVSLLAYTRVAEDGGLALERYPMIRRWIADAEHVLALPPVR
jgi:glutathione S-transferase